MSLDVAAIRRQFPILTQRIHGCSLVYLDNAATSQKPLAVLEAMETFYRRDNANINRGVHVLGERATAAYTAARSAVRRFLNAKHVHEVLFMRNATEGINLIAKTWGRTNVRKGDVVVLTVMEHHSNIVPWLQLAAECQVELKWVEIGREGRLDLAQLDAFLGERDVKLVTVTAVSNVLGTVNPVAEIAARAHAHGALVLVDAAQLAPHHAIDVQALGCDFLAFSAHKVYGPTGIGVLYGRAALLDTMPPFLGGGDMIAAVERGYFTPAELPRKFEAGTPAIAEAVGLQAAIEWVRAVGFAAVEEHEERLIAHALERLQTVRSLTILGPENPRERTGCISFTLAGVHPHDLTQLLSDQGICLRAGHHCAQPLHRTLGIEASTRLSVGVYNTLEEIDACVEAIEGARERMKN